MAIRKTVQIAFFVVLGGLAVSAAAIPRDWVIEPIDECDIARTWHEWEIIRTGEPVSFQEFLENYYRASSPEFTRSGFSPSPYAVSIKRKSNNELFIHEIKVYEFEITWTGKTKSILTMGTNVESWGMRRKIVCD
ncbi:hypothetical protein DS906_11845 [Ruegeria sp. A3M17]|nr:hypothetical protein DS906_11845 [Ruegeria sp. A3M17]